MHSANLDFWWPPVWPLECSAFRGKLATTEKEIRVLIVNLNYVKEGVIQYTNSTIAFYLPMHYSILRYHCLWPTWWYSDAFCKCMCVQWTSFDIQHQFDFTAKMQFWKIMRNQLAWKYQYCNLRFIQRKNYWMLSNNHQSLISLPHVFQFYLARWRPPFPCCRKTISI